MVENETTWVIDRMKLYNLLREHPTWSLRRLAAELGRSKSWVGEWKKRFKSAVKKGWTWQIFQRRPAPARQSRWSQLVIETILSLRDELTKRYYRKVGPVTILYHLKEDNALKRAKADIPQSTRTIWKILKAAGRIPTVIKVYTPLERPDPLEEVEADFGVCPSLGGEHGIEFLAVIDRGTSVLIDAQVQLRYTAASAIQAFAQLFLLNGLPKRLRMDRDSRLVGSWSRRGYPSPLIQFLRNLNVEPVICPPYRPDLKPFVERVIRTMKHEWLFHKRPASPLAALESLSEFTQFYNFQRPHQGRSCRNRPPRVAFPELPALPTLPTDIDPDKWIEFYDGTVYRRKVRANGSVVIDTHSYHLGRQYRGQYVGLHLDAEKKVFHFQLDGKRLKVLPIKGLHRQRYPLQKYLKLLMQEATAIERYLSYNWAGTNWEEPFTP